MYLSHRVSLQRSLLLTKWVIFGVTLPLLPIACKVLAEWMDAGRANWSLSNLFGDGELLVIATVISAAGIGDLIFDLRGTKRRRRFRDASAIAAALVCIIGSVTLYALVTLKREQLNPAQQTLVNEVQIQQSQLNSQVVTADRLTQELKLAQGIQQSALAEYLAQLPGRNGVPPGNNRKADILLRQYQDYTTQVASLQTALKNSQSQISKQQGILSSARLTANSTLAGKTPYNSARAARASLWMFWFGFLAGFNCLLAGSAKRRGSRVGALSDVRESVETPFEDRLDGQDGPPAKSSLAVQP